jgi:hypothetical protein
LKREISGNFQIFCIQSASNDSKIAARKSRIADGMNLIRIKDRSDTGCIFKTWGNSSYLPNTQPVPGEGIIRSNYGGVGSWDTMAQCPLAIHVEGLPPASIPTLNEWGMILFMISLMLVSLYF